VAGKLDDPYEIIFANQHGFLANQATWKKHPPMYLSYIYLKRLM